MIAVEYALAIALVASSLASVLGFIAGRQTERTAQPRRRVGRPE